MDIKKYPHRVTLFDMSNVAIIIWWLLQLHYITSHTHHITPLRLDFYLCDTASIQCFLAGEYNLLITTVHLKRIKIKLSTCCMHYTTVCILPAQKLLRLTRNDKQLCWMIQRKLSQQTAHDMRRQWGLAKQDCHSPNRKKSPKNCRQHIK